MRNCDRCGRIYRDATHLERTLSELECDGALTSPRSISAIVPLALALARFESQGDAMTVRDKIHQALRLDSKLIGMSPPAHNDDPILKEPAEETARVEV
jgi:hypothetical protein